MGCPRRLGDLGGYLRQRSGLDANEDARTRHDFRLWRSAVGGAPRQQFRSSALSPRRRGAEAAERGRGDWTGRPTGSRARKGPCGDSAAPGATSGFGEVKKLRLGARPQPGFSSPGKPGETGAALKGLGRRRERDGLPVGLEADVPEDSDREPKQAASPPPLQWHFLHRLENPEPKRIKHRAFPLNAKLGAGQGSLESFPEPDPKEVAAAGTLQRCAEGGKGGKGENGLDRRTYLLGWAT
ncbi:hypothetical protein TREES_T100004518 [Tupaia chinensis]|uniref:Uncharacterized protein n=1 Tax=Tupaia chinensis TaxID=246437 RepID=L9JVW8_TUPCH|nr:hypothetical protein TREES_T100004518 [Tupaia chinensis]